MRPFIQFRSPIDTTLIRFRGINRLVKCVLVLKDVCNQGFMPTLMGDKTKSFRRGEEFRNPSIYLFYLIVGGAFRLSKLISICPCRTKLDVKANTILTITTYKTLQYCLYIA